MSDKPHDKIQKTPEQWREQLGEQRYRVTREGATEPAFTGEYYATKTPGAYHCVCCGLELFRSEQKYDSGSGWPSFYAPADAEHVRTEIDETHGMVRTEVLCARCDAHLGHAFPDGPRPTGIRFCINSAALALNPRSE